jgi:hypothetical protein
MLQRLSRPLANIILVLVLFAQGHAITSAPLQRQAPAGIPPQAGPCDGILYDFVQDAQGWQAADYSKNYGTLEWTGGGSPNPPADRNSLGLTVDLGRGQSSAEFLVNRPDENPLSCAHAFTPEDAVISAWVWAPKGSAGKPGQENGVHLFAVDDKGHKLYGAWQSIQEETWFEVKLRLAQEMPACGSMDRGFDPDKIVQLGLNIGANSGQTISPQEQFHLAGVSVGSDKLPPIESSHLYAFENASDQDGIPQWRSRKQEWGAKAFTNLYIENKTLATDASFLTKTKDDSTRKGVISMVYAPTLDISQTDLDQNTFNVDVRFENAMTSKNKCPFGLTLWVYDAGKKSWYTSPYQNVGDADWTRITYPLSEFRSADHPDQSLDQTQIGEIALQIWGNTDYQGKIWFDNISLGGEIQPPQVQPISGVTVDGPHFSLEGQRFRFIGGNAEYLPFVPTPVMEQVLQWADDLGLTVIRTWGFGEGCEDNQQVYCVDRTHYFQPSPGVYNEAAFEHFDQIVYQARQHGLRLIIPLANNWGEYGGIPQYVCWQRAYNPFQDPGCARKPMSDELHDKFYTDERIKALYRNYIDHFVNHQNPLTGLAYKDDPTILAWELVNEPRALSDVSGQTLHDWISEMSSHLQGQGITQLIGTGEEGWYIMPKESAEQFTSWQSFSSNYWHYGVNWTQAGCESGESNGVDFLSDNSSTPREVTWQKTVYDPYSPEKSMTSADSSTEYLDSPKETEVRQAVPAIGYTTIHLYPAPGETSLPLAPYCTYAGLDNLCSNFSGAHQAKEWINQHVKDSHQELNKPFVLEEFNFPVLGTTTSSINFQVTPEQRARLFTQYLDMAYNQDVDGAMFWNLGYDGFAKQSWGQVASLQDWNIKSETDSTQVQSGTAGIRMDYDPKHASDSRAVMVLPDPKVEWLRADGNQVFVDLQNEGDAQGVMFQVNYADGHREISDKYPLTSGKNHLILDELFKPSQPAPSKDGCSQHKPDPAHVTGMEAILFGYKDKGSATFDFYSVFNNKYVIYPGDPVEKVIKLATQRWQQSDAVTQPIIQLEKNPLCDQSLTPEQIEKLKQEQFSIPFTLSGGLEHPDGYYFRYQVAYPDQNVKTGIQHISEGTLGYLPIDMIPSTGKGAYQITIVPEGEDFASTNAASCVFTIGE